MDTSENQKMITSVNISVTTTKIEKIESDLQIGIFQKNVLKRYKNRHYNFMKNYNIKTSKSTIDFNKSIETIKFLAVEDINKYTKDYKFLHIGLVK